MFEVIYNQKTQINAVFFHRFIKQRILKKSYDCINKLFNTDNKKGPNSYVIMISVTLKTSNDAENSALQSQE